MTADEVFVGIQTEDLDVVVTDEDPTLDVVLDDSSAAVVIVEGSVGPRGPQGPSGSMTFEGTAWWTGEGPPGTIVGSKPGDEYIDTLTGTVYKLEVN